MKRLERFIRKIENSSVTASFLILVLMAFTKLLGFIKLRAIASYFGAGQELDVFWAAFAIPDFVFTLLIAGTVNAALIPVFMRVKEKYGDKKVREVLNSVLVLNIVVWLVLWLLVYMFTPHAVSFALRKHVAMPGTVVNYVVLTKRQYINLFIRLTNVLFLSPFILGISSIIGAYLNTYKRFLAASLAPLFYNIGIVLGLLFGMQFCPTCGVWNLVIAVLVGSLLHLLVQVRAALQLGYVPSIVLKFSRYVRDIVTLSLPRILGLAVEQVAIMFDTFWSLLLGAGALSVFKYASSLQAMPVHLFVNSILQASFPDLNKNAAKNGKSVPFVKMFLEIFAYLFWVLGFVAAIVVVMKIPLVKLALGTGKFTDKEVLRTALTLAAFAGAIVFYGFVSLIIRAFYALHQTKKPFLVSVLGVIFNILFSIGFSNLFSHTQFIEYFKKVWATKNIFTPPGFGLIDLWYMFTTRSYNPLSVVGLALGISIALGLEVLVAIILLNTEVQVFKTALSDKRFKGKMLQVTFANLLVFIVGSVAYEVVKGITGYSILALLLQVTVVLIVTGILYVLLTRDFLSVLLGKLNKLKER